MKPFEIEAPPESCLATIRIPELLLQVALEGGKKPRARLQDYGYLKEYHLFLAFVRPYMILFVVGLQSV